MKKLIFISGIQIFPPESGGQVRSANICRAYKNLGYEVEIYSFTGRKNDYLKFKKTSETIIEEKLTERVNRNPIMGLTQYLFYIFKLPPLWLVWLTQLYIPKDLKNLIKDQKLIILDFPYLFPIINRTKNKVIVNTHNAEYELFTKKPLICKIVKTYEMKCFQEADQIYFCTEEDAKKYSSTLSELEKKLLIIPNGVDVLSFTPKKEIRTKTREKLKINENQKVILFTGSKYGPNIEAFKFLKSWTKENIVELQKLDILILVVGSVSLEIINEKHFKVLGRVKSIFPYLWASDFGINPVIEGSGTNIKMIEFMASNLPIISTSFGARGFKLKDQESCYFFERGHLLNTLKKITSLNILEREIIAKKAIIENNKIIDMRATLESMTTIS